ncbi:hypothetical protein [Falsiroseomonas sp. HW251]|uniref:hypothetical protein n=1 Tax=Falsiroseomonas sp. HW251 TaxID=3390998 RepID=UPI003D31DA5C
MTLAPGRSRIGPHEFAVGQDVEFMPSVFDRNIPRGGYVVTRALPGDDDGRTYRARSSTDGLERVFREAQLKAGRAFFRA